jgi:hypothetical protein
MRHDAARPLHAEAGPRIKKTKKQEIADKKKQKK